MNMSAINSISNVSGMLTPQLGKQPTAKASFGETLGDMMGQINDQMIEAGKGAEKIANGEVTDIHQVMVAAEKASIGLEMVIEIRNKLLEAYQQVMRTQV
jgi:flagellar hook-basal body complex protein FliE